QPGSTSSTAARSIPTPSINQRSNLRSTTIRSQKSSTQACCSNRHDANDSSFTHSSRAKNPGAKTPSTHNSTPPVFSTAPPIISAPISSTGPPNTKPGPTKCQPFHPPLHNARISNKSSSTPPSINSLFRRKTSFTHTSIKKS